MHRKEGTTSVKRDAHSRSEGHCRCGNRAVYFRRYEGSYLCSACLIKQVEKKFRENAKPLINKGDRIAVGLSGSKDSSVLLYLLHKFYPRTARIIAITIDEGIAGYRDKSIAAAKELAKKLGIEHRIFSFQKEFHVTVDGMQTDKYCTACGVFRRQLLNKAAMSVNADKIAIGHNLDDEAQSIMMNVIRGDFVGMRRLGASGQDGLVPRIKPLANMPEKEIKLYAILNSIKFYEGECPHSHNNLRRDVQKIINDTEDAHPGTKMQILSFYEKMKGNKVPKRITKCKTCYSPSSSGKCKACEITGKK